ncbi:transposase [Nonomuraea sp. LPB2021202275-12-8]|uniref:transposase n=1 Tax=Nonomuraea sp. LPB2021202275-12-8 TaxID=3120159 RepID=UPI003FA527A3
MGHLGDLEALFCLTQTRPGHGLHAADQQVRSKPKITIAPSRRTGPEDWAARAEASPARELRHFVAGLRRDWAAVKAGLTLPYSSGAVEGNANRIKMIKRIMYGRANPDLLRVRVLHGY